MNKDDIMYQEIDIKLNLIFSKPQVRGIADSLDTEIKRSLNEDFYADNPEPMWVKEIESSMNNVHIRIGTSVDARKNEPEISQYIINKIKKRLNFGVVSAEVLGLREEAEIYGNK